MIRLAGGMSVNIEPGSPFLLPCTAMSLHHFLQLTLSSSTVRQKLSFLVLAGTEFTKVEHLLYSADTFTLISCQSSLIF
jgi:hypothetical protein